jgi:DNA repair protein RadC
MKTKKLKFPSTLAEISVSYKSTQHANSAVKITMAADAFKLLQPIFQEFVEHHEEFWIVLLNRANKVIGISQIGKGGIAGTVADPKIIFQCALKTNASSIVMAHNHPSGQLFPSQADIQLTNKIKDAGKLLDLQVLDHLIITAETFYSFQNEGLL